MLYLYWVYIGVVLGGSVVVHNWVLSGEGGSTPCKGGTHHHT